MENIEYENNKEIIKQFLKIKIDYNDKNLKENEIHIRKISILNALTLRNDIEKIIFSRIVVLITKSDYKIEDLIGFNDFINSEIKIKVKDYYKKHNKNHNNLINLHKKRELL